MGFPRVGLVPCQGFRVRGGESLVNDLALTEPDRGVAHPPPGIHAVSPLPDGMKPEASGRVLSQRLGTKIKNFNALRAQEREKSPKKKEQEGKRKKRYGRILGAEHTTRKPPSSSRPSGV